MPKTKSKSKSASKSTGKSNAKFSTKVKTFFLGKPKKPRHQQKFYETTWFFVTFVVVFAIVFRSFFFSPFHIPSGSMKPNLLIGDYIFVSKYSYGYSRYSLPFGVPLIKGKINATAPNRGDIVVFKPPSDLGTDYIKRLIGLPGDRIQVRNGIVFINGAEVKRTCSGFFEDEQPDGKIKKIKKCEETLPSGKKYIVIDEKPNGQLDNTDEYTVPPNHYFMMGDNRDNSMDSRVMSAVGYVPEENLVGKARVIVVSFGHWNRFFINLNK